jgi:DNA-binding transcriptional LysR family regulator
MKRRRLPPLSALRAFESFARNGRMVVAADELFVTHGAISRQIKQLEAWLGLPLIEGPKSRLRLTPAGDRLGEVLGQAFDDIESALPRRRPARRVLRVSCLGTFAMKWLIPRLPRFYALHPDAAVEVSESYAPVDFSEAAYDVAVRVVASEAKPGLPATPFLTDYLGPVMAPALAGQPLCGLRRLHTRSYPAAWAEWYRRADEPVAETADDMIFDHTFYMLAGAAAGLGVAIGSWWLTADELRSGALVAPFGLQAMPHAFALIEPIGGTRADVARFREWLVAEGRQAATPESG